MTNKNTQGVEAARAGDLLKAENLFKQAYKEDPTNQGIFQNIIRVMQMTGNIDGLLDFYEQNQKSNSQTLDRQIGQQIVELALRSGKNQMAQKILEKQVQKGDYSIETVVPLSEILFKKRQLEQAKKILIKAIEYSDKDPSLLTNLAVTETELGNYKIADQLYKTVTIQRPTEFLGYYNYSKFKLATGNPEEAMLLVDKADCIVNNTKEAKELRRLIDEYMGSSNSIITQIYTNIENKQWEDAYNKLKQNYDKKSNSKWMSAACELPEKYQEKLDTKNECDPEQVVRCIQLIPENDEIIAELVKAIKEESTLTWNRADKPTTGGYQTYELLKNSEHKCINILKSKIIQAIKKQTYHQYSEISGWGVILMAGGYQKKHTHSEAEVSGVVYLQVPDAENDQEGCLLFSGYKKKLVKPKKGMLTIFPSYLPHETTIYEENSERICIAFNAKGKQ